MPLRPWLILPPTLAHAITPLALKAVSRIIPANQRPEPKLEFQWKNLKFKNRFGIAGGVDKNADNPVDWQRLGAGFLEIGTITPEPQSPNPGQILLRDRKTNALWNKMGFPNAGSLQVLQKIEAVKSKIQVPLFINVGKNRQTSNEKSHLDYAHGMKAFKDVADVFVVNISSPNTQGLRNLLGAQILEQFLTQLLREAGKVRQPILLKLSPDMLDSEFAETILMASGFVNGFILTNTTTGRQQTPQFPSEGGVSGEPLRELSESLLKLCVKTLGSRRKDFLLVSCGGVVNPDDALRRLQMGADLVQTYSGLIYYGPHFFQDCCQRSKML